jgi:hypothetical protein
MEGSFSETPPSGRGTGNPSLALGKSGVKRRGFSGFTGNKSEAEICKGISFI